jgi:hypothetical protein
MPEQSKHLVEYLFNPAMVNCGIETTMQATLRLQADPGNKDAEAELDKALDDLIVTLEATRYGPFPRLTDEENDQYKNLKKKKFEKLGSDSGHIWTVEVKLNEEEELLFQKLEAKVDGREITNFCGRME